MQYHYPGNVRELKAGIELAAVLCDDAEIDAKDISFAPARNGSMLTGEEKTLRQYTVQIVKMFLEKYDNNVLKVADKLDVGKSTIYKMIQDKEIIL
ncbi:hypothetical protein [Phnomibacter ginsenosidimutans]|uniref:hypothetical protein n=1 Tax=Phnomibacter ginsenosidimutans TaxID=2676868 RepID=UPI001FE4AF65|nr:hypothetical protein [Phnomibacter ginsenosidimutans]